jgi:hypothetical protein
VIDAPSQTDDIEAVYRAAKALFDEGRISLATLPEAARALLREQLRLVVAKPRPGGGHTISAPRASSKQTLAKLGKSVRGHADSVSALVRALWRVGSTDRSLWRVRPAIWRRKRGASGRPAARAVRGGRDDYQIPGSRDDYR